MAESDHYGDAAIGILNNQFCESYMLYWQIGPFSVCPSFLLMEIEWKRCILNRD